MPGTTHSGSLSEPKLPELRGVVSRSAAMAHDRDIVFCAGPESPHAFDNVSLLPRNGTLDALCPICRGHGQWNAEIDLASFRCRRDICGRCYGAGWVETGNDPIALPDIELSAEGYPRWGIRYVSPEEEQNLRTSAPLATRQSGT